MSAKSFRTMIAEGTAQLTQPPAEGDAADDGKVPF
jgi:hypothetical protein